MRVCFALLRKLSVLMKGVVSAFWVFVGLLCVCLPAMPLPAPDVPASQRLALDCRTLLDHRVGKGKWQQHLLCSLSGSFSFSKFLGQNSNSLRSCFRPYGSMIPYKNMSCPKWKMLFGVWPALSCSDSAFFYSSLRIHEHFSGPTLKRNTGWDWYLAQVAVELC